MPALQLEGYFVFKAKAAGLLNFVKVLNFGPGCFCLRLFLLLL